MLDLSQSSALNRSTYLHNASTDGLEQSLPLFTRTPPLDTHGVHNGTTTSLNQNVSIIIDHLSPPMPPSSPPPLPALAIDCGNTTTLLHSTVTNSLSPISHILHNATSNNFSFRVPSSSTTTMPTIGSTSTRYSNHTLLDDDNDVLRTIEYIGNVLCFYYVPIIVGTGSIGNILSVFVFFKTKLRKLSSSFYLAALAVSDTCFLFGLFVQWLNFVDVHIYNREYFCQFFTFFSNLACFCSVWFVVAFTVERFIAVMYPLKRQTMCTVRRAKIVLLGLTLLGCLHCAPFWVSSTPVYLPKLEMTICDIKNEYKDYITILNYWDTVVVFAVPFTTIAVLNTFTGCTVWKFATVRRTLTMQKMKTQHLPLTQHHETIVRTPIAASNCGTTAINTTSTTTVACLAGNEQEQFASATYHHHHRLSSASTGSTRSKTNCCVTTTLNGQDGSASEASGDHQHPNRSSLIKHHAQTHRHPHISHQHHHFAIAPKGGCSGKCSQDSTKKSGRRKPVNSSQIKVTKMLLIVSTVFVCLNLPSCIMRMITYMETQSSANEKTTVVLQYIFQLLFVTNFGINFVLYCVSGQNFRKAFLSLFRRVSATQRDVTTQITVSECYRNSGCGLIATGGNGSLVTGSISASTRRRMMMTQNSWNEVHEMQRLK